MQRIDIHGKTARQADTFGHRRTDRLVGTMYKYEDMYYRHTCRDADRETDVYINRQTQQ